MRSPVTPPDAPLVAPESPEATPAPGARPAGGPRTLLRRLMAIPTPVLFVGSIGLALVLLWRQGALGKLGAATRAADPGEVVAGFALYLAGLALLCARWHLLVRMTKGQSDIARASEAFLTSVVINYAAPIGLAVPTRAALTKRALGLSAAETGSVALWEVLIDVVVLGVGSVLWLAATPAAAGALGDAGARVSPAAAGALAVGVLAAAAGTWLALRRPALRRRLGEAPASLLRYPRLRPAVAVTAVAVTVVYWVGQGAVLWLLLGALGAERGGGLVLGLTTLPVLVGMLSPVPGGAGVREALMVVVARASGAGGADAAAVLVAAFAYRVALFAAIPVLYAGVRAWLAVRGATADGAHLRER